MVLSAFYSMYDGYDEDNDGQNEEAEITSDLDPGVFQSLPTILLDLIMYYLSASELANLGTSCSDLLKKCMCF